MRYQFEFIFTTVGLVENELLGDMIKRREQAEDILLAPYEANGNVQGAPLGAVDSEKAKQRKF
jgi:hypothetical protein